MVVYLSNPMRARARDKQIVKEGASGKSSPLGIPDRGCRREFQ